MTISVVSPISTSRGQHNKAAPFWYGGAASCVATLVSHPFDLTKVRLQTVKGSGASGMLTTMVYIVRNEGILGVYNGLSASLLRQGTYSTVRFGLYDQFKAWVAKDEKPTFWQLLFCSTSAGALGGAFGNPSDVVNVRMQNDGQLPPAMRRNYRNAIDGLIRICREENPRVLARGIGPNMNRAILMTCSQLTSYDAFKQFLLDQLNLKDGFMVHLEASIFAGLVATTVCSPLDVVKTRIMSANKHRHQTLVKHLVDIAKIEGVRALFKGWTPAFLRLGPHTIVTFLVLEELKRWHSSFVGTTPPSASLTTT
ncbi:hypothetical protein K450DRAFT_259638 [Umbelopsis ramanniana AG]|uniref:Mitochondrial carrier n=1 Tax=Umbelopsis ramanniana AG TaxID=1314678 RepID=A0AAD5HB67_UMBRA|nr:uncharacterized protein K450DRAFT_259638 [Umbelopsis ramanniana AG]KAI8575883.1 hypothetical protein K450DRAFT_259638 [Umbelopsis ramanniana AG]